MHVLCPLKHNHVFLRMMVPALLFIEKPYYDNLMARGKNSPFRSKSTSISLIYMVMVLKTSCILYVNFVLIYSKDCQPSTTGPHDHPCLGAEDTTSDGLISSTNVVSDVFVPKLAVLGTCAHSLVYLYSMVWTHMGGGATSTDIDSPGNSESESESEGDSDIDDEDNLDIVADTDAASTGGGAVGPLDADSRQTAATTQEQMACLQADQAVAPGTRVRA